jgi:hypothetical protein
MYLSIPDEVTGFCSWPKLTQPVTEMGTRNLPGGKTDILTAICEPII